MNILDASSAVLKNSTRVAWWGLALGVFVGLHVAGALAKPLAGEVNRGLAAMNKGFSSLRDRMAKKTEEDEGGLATEGKEAAAAEGPFKIPVEDVAPEAPSEGEEAPGPKTPPDTEARASRAESPGGEPPSIKWLKVDLLEEARRLGVAVQQTMTKKELIEAINVEAINVSEARNQKTEDR